MKVYELQFRDGDNFDESSFVLWVKTDGHLEAPGAVVCKEIDIKPNMPGIDLTMLSKKSLKKDTEYVDKEDLVTVRKAIIKDIISNLRKAIKKGEKTGLEFFCPDVRKAVSKLYQVLNKGIS